MAKNANVSDGTLPTRIEKKKNIVEGSASKVTERPKIIGNIEEPKDNSRVIKIPKVIKVNDKRKRYLNPITLNYVLRPTYLASLRKIKEEGGRDIAKGREKDQLSKDVISFKESSRKLYKIIRNQNH